MQQAMTRFRAIKTPTGTPVSLGMTVAIAAGSVRRFLVGDPSIQYIDVLAGATLTRMAAAEQQAAKGEVVVSSEVVAQLDDKLEITEFRQDEETGARFAVVTGLSEIVTENPWPTSDPALTEEQIQPWLLAPVYERLKTGQGRFLAEIRPAVALFMRFGGIDYDQDETAGHKLDAYIRWVQSIVARYEGALLQLTLGDKGSYLYIAFGAPITHEHDSARAVATALELQSPPPELDYIDPVQIGISRGRMRTGAYGGSTRSTYGVIGDEVNMAARFMDRAKPGQIMVSQRIAEAVKQNYLLEYVGPIEVKGAQKPVPVSLVLGCHLPVTQKPIGFFPFPLVGRDKELAQLERLLNDAPDNPGQILRIEGAAGVGKSHLVAEFAGHALGRHWRVVSGVCQSMVQDVPYYAWRQIFRALFVLTDELAEGEDWAVLATRHIAQVEATVSELNSEWLLRLPLLGDLLDLPIPDNPTTAAFEPRLRQETLFSLAVDLIRAWAKAPPAFAD
jgi:adenylate cyclase